ncbi:MAG TPA: phage holin family protein [Chthoniobacteraceae bacterium]|nr:phage holin family protein [Chthoniobacteraceae bacterium]
MPVPTTSGGIPPGKEGMVDNLRALAASVAAYLSARLQLAGIESREAGVHYLKILALLGVAVFGVVFGYIFLCLAAVFLLHNLLKVDWIWILFGAAVFHLIVAAAAVLIAKARFPKAVFSATIAEFKKDQTWLNTPTTKPH